MSSSRGLVPPSSRESPATLPEMSTGADPAGTGPDWAPAPGSTRPCVRRRPSRRTQLVEAPSPALHLSCIPSLHLSRCSRRPPLGPLLLLERPSPWTYRPPPAEATAGPVAIFVAQQPTMHATNALVDGRSRTVAAGAHRRARRMRRGKGGETGSERGWVSGEERRDRESTGG